MLITNLLFNLADLVALSVFSGFIDSRYDKKTFTGKVLQGILFSIVTILGMQYPFVFNEGIIFDGRSIIISLCTLFFGPVSGAINAAAAIIFRIYIGGSGTLTGSFVIISSFLIGYIFNTNARMGRIRLSNGVLYVFGLITSVIMMILMITLPSSQIIEVFSGLTFSVIVFYPVVTLISGKVLLDHQEKKEYLIQVNNEKNRYYTTLYSIGDGVISTDEFGNILTINPTAQRLTGWSEPEAIGKPLEEIFVILNEFTRSQVENPVKRVLREGKRSGLSNHTILITRQGKEVPVSNSGSPIKNQDGIVTGVVLIFQDQSAEREARRKIEESEFRLRRAELASKCGNWELHLDSGRIMGSEGAAAVYGLHNNEMNYADVKNIPLPEYRPILDLALKNLIEMNEPYDLEFKIKTADKGQIKDVHTNAFYEKEKNVLFGVIQDITLRKAAEEALRESEKNYRDLFMINPHPMWVYDIDTLKFIMVNDSAVSHYGYNREEFLQMTIKGIRPDEDMHLLDQYLSNSNPEVTKSGIWRHRKKDGTLMYVEIVAHKMVYKNRNSEMVLANDVTERLYQQQVLKENEKKFRLLIEQASDAICLIYKEKFELINTRFTELTGYVFNDLQRPDFSFWDVITPASCNIVRERIEGRKRGKDIPAVYEINLLRKDGTEVACEISVAYIKYRGGTAAQSVIRDITQRKQAHIALQEISRNLNATLNATEDGILAVGLNRKVLFFNDRFSEQWRIPKYIFNNRDDNMMLSFVKDQLLRPELFVEEVERLYSSDENSFDTLYFKDGRVFERYSFPLRHEMSLRIGRVWSFRDVTKRKRAEENLMLSERNLRAIFEYSPLGIYIAHPDGNILDANETLLKMLGSPSFEETQKINILTFPPLIKNGYADKFRECTEEGRVIEYEILYKSKWGKEAFFQSYFVPLKDSSGKLEKVYALINDITDRKKLERQIKESELKFRTVADFTNDWEYWIGPDNEIIYISPSCERITGYTPQEFYGNPELLNKIVFPDDGEIWNHSVSATESKTAFKCDIRIVKKNNEVIWINHICNAIYAENGNYLGRRASNRDITERKHTENSLLQLKKAVDTSGEAIFLTNVEGIFTYINPAFTSLYGYTDDEVIGKVTPRILKSGLLDQCVYINFWKTLLNGSENKGELINKKKDGSFVNIEGSATPILDEGNKIFGFLGIQRNITERKTAENALKDSENRYRNLIMHSPDAIFVNQNDRVILVNYACLELFGAVSDTEILGKSPFELFHPDFHEPIRRRIQILRESGESVPLAEEKIIRLDGNIVDVEVVASPFKLGTVNAIHVILRDISARKKAEEEIRESEEKFRSIFQNHSAVKLLLDPETGNILDANNSAAVFYKWSIDHLKRMNISQINTLPAEEIKNEMRKASTRQSNYFEFRHRKADGTIRDVEVYSSTVMIKGKAHLHSIIHDITEKKQAERLLKENEEKMRLLVEGTSYFFFYTHNVQGEVTYISPSVEKITGYKVEEWIGQSHWFTTDSPLNSLVRERTRKMLKGESLKNPIILEIYNFSGKRILLEIYEVPLVKEGTIIGLQGIAHDITERNRLLQNIQKLSSAVEQSPVSILITDINGNIEYVNPKFTEVTGYSREEALESNPRILKSGRHNQEFYEDLWQTIRAGKNWSGVFHNKKSNGQLFWESAIISPIKNEEGEIINFVAVKEDITEKIKKETELSRYREHLENLVEERTEKLDQLNRDLVLQLQKEKELEEQLNLALSKEKEVNELKTRFIATVSHEFRTPLASLLSSTQMIQRYSKRWSEEKLNEQYYRIASTVHYLTQLLDDVLTISRSEREALSNNPQPQDIDALIKTYIEDVRPMFSRKHNLIFTNSFREKIISVDPKLLHQVIINLLTNAVKYSPNGGLIEVKMISNETNQLQITVTDQGLGIPEDECQYIFEAFYRSKNSVGIQGTGLGLNIVKRCIDLMGGSVSLKTSVNNGTSFTILIPNSYEQSKN